MKASPVRTRLQVFLVEDATAVRRKIAEALSAIPDVSVIGEAEDAASALTGIAQSGADVAVVDLRLASGSGIELLSLLAHEQPSVVTVVLTNHSAAPFRTACQRAGAHFFFDKTSEFEAACEAIEALVNRRAAPAR
ncbi:MULTISPECIES: response regulator transcription factor [unclassified Paraburkholderia]|uniref:response regulator n=1 Tax=unclassified Paraburkholderia TaxID=2615204 RepID=UPI002AB66A5C|nr:MULTISPECIES: response regulator [unclassified Paraburkholderia]